MHKKKDKASIKKIEEKFHVGKEYDFVNHSFRNMDPSISTQGAAALQTALSPALNWMQVL